MGDIKAAPVDGEVDGPDAGYIDRLKVRPVTDAGLNGTQVTAPDGIEQTAGGFRRGIGRSRPDSAADKDGGCRR